MVTREPASASPDRVPIQRLIRFGSTTLLHTSSIGVQRFRAITKSRPVPTLATCPWPACSHWSLRSAKVTCDTQPNHRIR
jgi:hypothetical protein